MEKGDKGSTLTRMGVSGWMFLLVPAKRPLNGCCCCCCKSTLHIFRFFYWVPGLTWSNTRKVASWVLAKLYMYSLWLDYWLNYQLPHFLQSTHTQPCNGLWSGTTRVGRYQKKHSPTHTLIIGHPLSASSVLSPFIQFTCLTVLFDNLSLGPLWSSSWSWTLYFVHPMHGIWSRGSKTKEDLESMKIYLVKTKIDIHKKCFFVCYI